MNWRPIEEVWEYAFDGFQILGWDGVGCAVYWLKDGDWYVPGAEDAAMYGDPIKFMLIPAVY